MTGRDDDFVLWELPYARGLRYLHAVAVANGTTMQLEEGNQEKKDSLFDGFQDLRARHGLKD